MEALCRSLSAEFASYGVRAVCLRSTGLPETATIDVVFGLHAKAMGITQEQFQKLMEGNAHTRRSTTLEELTNVAVFMASDLASGMTGTIANVTGGKVVDYRREEGINTCLFRTSTCRREFAWTPRRNW